MSKQSYPALLRTVLNKSEQRLLSKLSTPTRVQDFLDHFPTNFSKIGKSVQSPSQVLANDNAHCIEGAILAAASLLFNGRQAWLLDLRASNDDEDHVVCLFKQNGLWGAISKTNHPVLRYRDPIYKSVRELAMSYVHEYYLFADSHFGKRVSKAKLGTKTLRAYSLPFSLKKYKPEDWWAAKTLDWLAIELDESPHYPLVPNGAIKNLRKASAVEIKAANLEEWKER